MASFRSGPIHFADGIEVAQVRVARPTDRREEVVRFYRNGLGLRERLLAMGHRPVAPENPYLLDKSVTFEDPDGWRVVFCQTPGI